MTLSRVVVLPMNVMRLTKNCCPSCIRIVTSTSGGPVGAGLAGSGAFSASGASGSFEVRLVARLEVGIAGELEVAARAVHFARLLEALADALLGVVLARLHLEERLQEVGLDDRVARDVEGADLVARALGDGNPQLDPARLLVAGVAEHLELGHADVRADVPVVAVVLDDLLGVLVELRFLVGALVADQRHDPHRKVDGVLKAAALAVLLHLALERAVANRLVADELDAADLDLRPLVHVEGQMHELRPARDVLDLVRDLRELEALLPQHVADDALDLADQPWIDERVEADLRARLLQLLVDLRDLDLLRAHVVDDLDALALLHVVDDELADHAVGEGIVARFDPEVVEEVGVPQPVEVLEDRLLGRLVVRHPDVLGGPALLQLDVVEVGLRLDDRGAALRLEAGAEGEDDRGGARRRLGPRRRTCCPQTEIGGNAGAACGSCAASGAAASASAATAHTRNIFGI